MKKTHRLVFVPLFAAAIASSESVLMAVSSSADDQLLIAAKSVVKPAPPRKQIFEASKTIEHSQRLNADGVAAYIQSTMGTNRGFLIKDLSGGLANDIGMSTGDVVMSFDGHVVQDARDVDRVLGRIASGNVKVMFVHPADTGLQLYNGSFKYTNAALTQSSVAQASGSHERSNQPKAAGNRNELQLLSSVESYVIELINRDRYANGVSGSLHSNAVLTELARQHATDMLKRGFFAHVNPDGVDPQGRARNAGVRMGVYENIAYETDNGSPPSMAAHAEAVFMSEPPNLMNHRGNILVPKHESVGVGVVMLGNRLMLVQEFADGDP